VAHNCFEGLVILTIITRSIRITIFKGSEEVKYHVNKDNPVNDVLEREEVFVRVHVEGYDGGTEQDVDHINDVHNEIPNEFIVVLRHPHEPV
jgi:hypothetical protein